MCIGNEYNDVTIRWEESRTSSGMCSILGIRQRQYGTSDEQNHFLPSTE